MIANPAISAGWFPGSDTGNQGVRRVVQGGLVGYHELLSNSSGSFCGKSLLVGGRVHLCNNGNSANFLHGGVVGPFIKLVQAELVHSLSTITSVGRSGIATLDRDARARIADTWLSFYSYA